MDKFNLLKQQMETKNAIQHINASIAFFEQMGMHSRANQLKSQLQVKKDHLVCINAKINKISFPVIAG